MENLLDVLKDAVGLGEGGAGGGEVIEDESAFVHGGEEVGAEGVVAEVAGDDEQEAGGGEGDRPGEREVEDACVHVEDAPHDRAVFVSGSVLGGVLGRACGQVLVGGGFFCGGVTEQEEAKGRSEGEGEGERGEERGRHGDGEGAEEAAGDSGDGDEGEEDDDGGEGGEDERGGDFAERAAYGLGA